MKDKRMKMKRIKLKIEIVKPAKRSSLNMEIYPTAQNIHIQK